MIGGSWCTNLKNRISYYGYCQHLDNVLHLRLFNIEVTLAS